MFRNERVDTLAFIQFKRRAKLLERHGVDETKAREIQAENEMYIDYDHVRELLNNEPVLAKNIGFHSQALLRAFEDLETHLETKTRGEPIRWTR